LHRLTMRLYRLTMRLHRLTMRLYQPANIKLPFSSPYCYIFCFNGYIKYIIYHVWNYACPR
jgi:hypothetical protein